MGDPKKIPRYNERGRSSGCCLNLTLTLCLLSAIASFGVVNYIQFEELWKLKVRVEELENICNNNKRDSQLEEHVNVERIRNKRGVATDSLTQFITNLVKSDVSVLKQYCGNASKICLPGPKGDPGIKGDPGLPGTKGQPGGIGVPGLMGFNGSKGEMGEKGEKGQNGLPGLAGHKGDRGQYGIPGLPGPKGDPGVAGVAGLKGQKGDVGPPLPANQQCCSALYKNECLSNPCRNNGTCVDQLSAYQCVCSAGYAGINCEIDIDECSSNPCRNNGTCVDKLSAYQCFCPAGYTGDNCETDIDECSSNPCRNNGTCIDQLNTYHFVCQAGYTGINCDIDINECLSNPCRNNGTCVDQLNTYHCVCPAGYTGINCDIDINECLSNPCRNNGTCVDQLNTYHCVCPAGYTGINCDIGCNKDIVFVLDASGGIGQTNFRHSVDFMRAIINGIDIGPHNSQVGLLVFSSHPQSVWHLNSFPSKASLITATGKLKYYGGSTRTHEALDYVRTTMLTPQNGDRASVDNVVIVITDGRSIDPAHTQSSARLLHQVSRDVIGIEIGNTNEREVLAIATSRNHVFDLQHFSAILSIVPNVINLTCYNHS